MALSYHAQVDIKNGKKLRLMKKEFPGFINEFFDDIENNTSTNTQVAYAQDIRIFLAYLLKNNPVLAKKYGDNLSAITLNDINSITTSDMREFSSEMKYPINGPENNKTDRSSDQDDEITNCQATIMRKVSTMKSLFGFLYKNELIEQNPMAKIPMPKVQEKDIVRLEPNQVVNLLDTIDAGFKESDQGKRFHEKNGVRDAAIITLLLGTGLRVSECVGIDIGDLDFENGRVNVFRKEGKKMYIYFGDEVEEALLKYMEQRKKITPLSGHENAFFLSNRRKRISKNTIENMTKQYSHAAFGDGREISPHKLRSTYASTLYEETGDVYLVADVLGHASADITKRRYASMQDTHRRMAKNAVKLRKD